MLGMYKHETTTLQACLIFHFFCFAYRSARILGCSGIRIPYPTTRTYVYCHTGTVIPVIMQRQYLARRLYMYPHKPSIYPSIMHVVSRCTLEHLARRLSSLQGSSQARKLVPWLARCSNCGPDIKGRSVQSKHLHSIRRPCPVYGRPSR